MISYVWFVLLLWPVLDRSALTSAWIGVGLLILSAILSYVLKGDHLRLATYLLIWGILGATACAMLTFQSPAVAYLFILPIIFASVLLRRRTVFLVATVAIFLILTIGLTRTPSISIEEMLPIAIILLVTIAS